MLICVLLQQIVPAAVASHPSAATSRRFEVCPCGSEPTPPEASFQLRVVNEQNLFKESGEVRVCASHHSGRVAVVDLEAGHGFDDGHHRLDGVAVDHRSVLLALVL